MILLLSSGCESYFGENTDASLSENCPTTELCDGSAIMMKDHFERANVLINSDESTDEINFWWRKIINDRGRIISGQAGNNVDVRIFPEGHLGPGSDDGSALYFYGRQGSSIHNIYLVSQTFDLSQARNVIISFKYLPINLEENEYLRLEVCRATPEECGVGDNVSEDGLNSDNWQTLLESDRSLGENLDGTNHETSDWKGETVNLLIDHDDLRTFIFRFNARMNDGFVDNDHENVLEDAVGLDAVTAFAYQNSGERENNDEEPIDGIDPFDILPFDPDDPRLF